LSRQLEWGLQEKGFKVLKAVQDAFFHFSDLPIWYIQTFKLIDANVCTDAALSIKTNKNNPLIKHYQYA
jgi:hypothetical protein